MQKNIFIILTGMLFILSLIYFYDQKELIQNKEYIKDNLHIEYPYFNNRKVDSYIEKYLNSNIDNINNIFIDYDYNIDNTLVLLNIYTYKYYKNKAINKKKSIMIDLDSNNITPLYSDNLEVDKIYNNKDNSNINISNKKLVALTFDDGPNHNTNKILDKLEAFNVKATFFVLGTNIKGNEEVLTRINSLGMQIGNHTYSHKLLTKLSQNKIKDEIDKTNNLIFQVTGYTPTILRPSYGSTSSKIKSVSTTPIITWNIDTQDWKYHNSKRISNTVFKNISDGSIILMHDIYTSTANSLDIIIPKLLQDGYYFVTIDELFKYKNINKVNGKVYRYVK